MTNTGKSVSEIASEVVSVRKPHVKNIVCEDSRPFLDGQILRVSYKDGRETLYDHVFMRKGDTALHSARLLEIPDDVVALVNERDRPYSFADRLTTQVISASGISGLIALVLVLTLCYLVALGKTPPDDFWKIMVLVVGFYFGTRTHGN